MNPKHLALAFLAATTTTFAAPTDSSIAASAIQAVAANTFKIQLYNNCPFQKQFALYQVLQPEFLMVQRSNPVNVPAKGHTTILAPYLDTGMRLSGHAEWGTKAQWNAQALFEFGYAEMGTQKGTSYNLSLMPKSDRDIGVGVYPIANGKRSDKYCESKTCFPWNCPLDQGWTNEDQIKAHSPADTVCYFGKSDFKVVFCP